MQAQATHLLLVSGFSAAFALVTLILCVNEARKGNKDLHVWLTVFFVFSVVTLILIGAVLKGVIAMLPQ